MNYRSGWFPCSLQMRVYLSAGQNTSKEKLKVDKSIYYLDEQHVQVVVITTMGCTSTEQTDTFLNS